MFASPINFPTCLGIRKTGKWLEYILSLVALLNKLVCLCQFEILKKKKKGNSRDPFYHCAKYEYFACVHCEINEEEYNDKGKLEHFSHKHLLFVHEIHIDDDIVFYGCQNYIQGMIPAYFISTNPVLSCLDRFIIHCTKNIYDNIRLHLWVWQCRVEFFAKSINHCLPWRAKYQKDKKEKESHILVMSIIYLSWR